MMTSSQVALQVLQEAVLVLAEWAGVKLPAECQCLDDNDAIAGSKDILGWTEESQIKPLRLLFDHVQLSPKQEQTEEHHYLPATRIGNKYARIPYPQEKEPDEQQQNALRNRITRTLNRLGKEDWENPSLQGATSALEGFLYQRYRSQPPLIKCPLIATRSDEFLYRLLTLMKRSYPIVAIQPYPKIAMPALCPSCFFGATNIRRFSRNSGSFTL